MIVGLWSASCNHRPFLPSWEAPQRIAAAEEREILCSLDGNMRKLLCEISMEAAVYIFWPSLPMHYFLIPLLKGFQHCCRCFRQGTGTALE